MERAVVSPGPPVSHPEPGRTARLAMVWVPAMESIVGRVGLTQGLDQVLALVAGRALVPAMGLGLDPVMGPVTDPGSVLRTGRGLADRQQAPSALLHQPTTRLNKSAPHSRFFPSTKRGVPHISLVFREMWDTTNPNLFSDLQKEARSRRGGVRLTEPGRRKFGSPRTHGLTLACGNA